MPSIDDLTYSVKLFFFLLLLLTTSKLYTDLSLLILGWSVIIERVDATLFGEKASKARHIIVHWGHPIHSERMPLDVALIAKVNLAHLSLAGV